MPNNASPAGPQPAPPTIVLTMNPDMSVRIEGDICRNKAVAYMMLEIAKDAIRDWHVANKAIVQGASLADMAQLQKP